MGGSRLRNCNLALISGDLLKCVRVIAVRPDLQDWGLNGYRVFKRAIDRRAARKRLLRDHLYSPSATMAAWVQRH